MNSKSEKYGLSEHKQVTNAPEVSSELIQELARMCGLIPSHTTAEWVSTLVRFVRVVLDNNSVQEAFVRANTGLLAVSPGLPEQSDYYKGWYAGLLDSEKRGASRAMLTDEQIDMIWEATRETLPQPVSEAFAMRAFARALLAASPAAPMQLPESMSRDEMLAYYSQYANLQCNEALRYQKRIRDLEAQLAAQPPAAAEAEPLEWQIEVAGPAGYVRFETFMGETLEAALDSVRKQNFCPAPDEDGFVTMKVKV